MPAFASEEDLRRYVGGIFEHALADDELGPKLRATGVKVKVQTTAPDAVLILDLPRGRIALGRPSDPADATMLMASEVINQFWQGRLNLPVAMARGHVTVDGKMEPLLALVPSTTPLFPAYIELLKRDGREDLLAT